jgi:hypothetical protein
MKHLPKIEDLIGRSRKAREPQSWEQQRDIARMYTVMLEGTVTQRQQAAQ